MKRFSIKKFFVRHVLLIIVLIILGLLGYYYFSKNSIYENATTMVESVGNNNFVTSEDGNSTFYTFPPGITEISDSMFDSATRMTSVVIPSTVTKIGNFAFFGCVNLKLVFIPTSVTSIGQNAFGSGLTVTFQPNSILTTCANDAFSSFETKFVNAPEIIKNMFSSATFIEDPGVSTPTEGAQGSPE
jgi:hypothetical protein